MDGAAVQGPRRDRRRPPSSHSPNSSRAVSRSSTRNSSARVPPLANNDFSSNLPSSPSLRYAQPVGSRFSHRRGSMASNTERPSTPVSKASVKGSHSSSHQESSSTLLQERLQRERRSEIQRNLNRLAGEMTTAVDSQTKTFTPARCATTDGKRPATSDTNGDAGGKKGLALKEMEQAMSSLHKQNFDLKLELFHRRERQSRLEEKIETLASENAQVQETNETLIKEVEKRDKALQEAVGLIISLESRMELLLRERELTRQAEADKDFLLKLAQSQSLAPPTEPGLSNGLDSGSQDQGKGLARMPSFLSERTENTENLRNVYLGTQGSILSLSKTDPRADNPGFVSPNMSILSESSFVSIYGSKTAPRQTSHTDAKNEAQPDGIAGEGGRRSPSWSTQDCTPPRPSAKDAIESGLTTSPLQKLEKLDSSPAMRDVSDGTPVDKDVEQPTAPKLLKPQPLIRIKKGKGKPAAARRVITDVPTHRAHTLPPTPDTMSSSMNQSVCSDETSHYDRGNDEAGYSMMTRLTLDQTSEIEPGQWRFKSAGAAQPPSVTAFTGRQEYSTSIYADMPLSLPRRPQSADETTISRHKADWDSESDLDDAPSEVSSFDYWMREGLRPNRGGQVRAFNGVDQPHRQASQDTPDLFGFPSGAKGWQSNDMFGALGGNGFLGAPLAPALDALGASLPAPEAGVYGSGLAGSNTPRPTGTVAAPPPAPHRRSSLRARTSAPGTPMTTRPPRAFDSHGETEPGGKGSLTGQGQRNSDVWLVPSSRSLTPTPPDRPQAQHHDEASAQKRHYPPIASHQQQAPASRPRSKGITSLFRRSLGSSHIRPSASVPNNQSPFPPPEKAQEGPAAFGVPMWERRNDWDDDEVSATPPPIMRNRAAVNDAALADTATARGTTRVSKSGKPHPLRSASPGLGAGLRSVLAAHDGGASLNPNTSGQEQDLAPLSGTTSGPGQSHGHGQSQSQSHSHARKWFGLGRAASSKHGGT